MNLLYKNFLKKALELVKEIQKENSVNVRTFKLKYLQGFLEGGLGIAEKFGEGGDWKLLGNLSDDGRNNDKD